jgi:hypothetical protein
MMATTHALAGAVLGTLVFLVAPEVGIVPVAAAALGGLFPDFDLYAGHRKTLHYPVYFSVAAVPATVLAFAVPTVASLSAALFLLAAATHSVMDAFGGGLELKPWEATSERAVYDHFRGRWVPPKRWVRYDGAPEDLLLAVALAVPPVVVFDGPVEIGVGVALAVSATYALLRKPMVVAAERVVAVLPVTLLSYVPDRFVEDFQ